MDIILKGNPTLIFCKSHPVSYSLSPIVSAELDRLEKLRIIKKVSYSNWVSPDDIVERGNDVKKVRICGDYKVFLNPVSRTKYYLLPNPNDIIVLLKEGKLFAVIDLKNAYQQLELSEKARELVTINTMLISNSSYLKRLGNY